jgi:hypothetical protein
VAAAFPIVGVAFPTKTGAGSVRFGLLAMRKWPAQLKPMSPKAPSATRRGRFIAELQERGDQSRRRYSGKRSSVSVAIGFSTYIEFQRIETFFCAGSRPLPYATIEGFGGCAVFG